MSRPKLHSAPLNQLDNVVALMTDCRLEYSILIIITLLCKINITNSKHIRVSHTVPTLCSCVCGVYITVSLNNTATMWTGVAATPHSHWLTALRCHFRHMTFPGKTIWRGLPCYCTDLPPPRCAAVSEQTFKG